MDQDSKTRQRRKGRRIALGSRGEPLHHDRLTPSDLLRLIPSPIMLPAESLAGYARRLEQRRERLRRLTARFAGKEFVERPRQIHLPKLATLEALAKEVASFPTHRKCLTRKEFGIYVDALRQVRGVIAGLMRKVQNAGHRACQDRYLVKIGRLVTDAPDDVLETFILTRLNKPGRNPHAIALARMRRATPEQLREWSRRALEAKRRKHALTAAAAPTSSPSAASANESPTPGALESE
jgi:hypothetical protein